MADIVVQQWRTAGFMERRRSMAAVASMVVVDSTVEADSTADAAKQQFS